MTDRVLVVPPPNSGEVPRFVPVPDLSGMQKLVGGYVDMWRWAAADFAVDVWFNDEGLMDGSLPALGLICEDGVAHLRGTLVVTSSNGEGETTGLPAQVALNLAADLCSLVTDGTSRYFAPPSDDEPEPMMSFVLLEVDP